MRNDALRQLAYCCYCEHRENCPDSKRKIMEAFEKPAFSMLKPTNPLHPNTPYKSKYFDDRRFDPPRELTVKDIIRALERSKK